MEAMARTLPRPPPSLAPFTLTPLTLTLTLALALSLSLSLALALSLAVTTSRMPRLLRRRSLTYWHKRANASQSWRLLRLVTLYSSPIQTEPEPKS